jgi:hypothetical protein
LSPDAVLPEERDDIERHYKLPTGWMGRSSPDGDIQIRNIRAHFYRSWGAFLSPEEAKARLRLPKRIWRDLATVADVLTRLAALLAKPERRSRRYSKEMGSRETGNALPPMVVRSVL